MWKNETMAYAVVLYEHLYGRTEENHENLSQGNGFHVSIQAQDLLNMVEY
jgi:hypothetical protein